MNAAVFRGSFLSGLRGLLYYGAVVLLIVAAGAVGFEAVRTQGQALGLFIRTLPPALLAAFQISPDSLTSPLGYVAARALGLMWPLMLLAFCAGAGATLAGMVERGTVHYELNLPIRRSSWLTSRFFAAFSGAALLVALTALALWLGAGLAAWPFVWLGLAFGWLWLGVAFLAASRANERGAVYAWTFGFFALQFLLTTLGRSLPDWAWLERLSVWTLYTPEQTLRSGADPLALAVQFGLGLLALVWAAVLWQRRDFPA